MRLQNRLRRLERRAGADHVREVSEAVEIWLPENGRVGLPPGRYIGNDAGLALAGGGIASAMLFVAWRLW